VTRERGILRRSSFFYLGCVYVCVRQQNSRPYGQNNSKRPGAARLLDPLVFSIDLANSPPPGAFYCFGRQGWSVSAGVDDEVEAGYDTGRGKATDRDLA